MRTDLTVIYYTNNRENEIFARNIQKELISSSNGLPIISVSQKPIDFGQNICVGEVGASGHNAWRQFQVGAMAAKTEFVCTAEADYLHPREYFQFMPMRDDTLYIAQPLYVLFAQRGKSHCYARKDGSEASMIVGRRFIIDLIDKMLEGRGIWHDPRTPDLSSVMYRMARRENFTLPIPSVTFKTDNNMHRKTPFKRSSQTKFLNGWGDANDLIRRYLNE